MTAGKPKKICKRQGAGKHKGIGVDSIVDAIGQEDDHCPIANGIPARAPMQQDTRGCAPVGNREGCEGTTSDVMDVHGAPSLGVKQGKKKKVKPRGSFIIMFHNVNSFIDTV